MSTFLACIALMASVFIAWLLNVPLPGAGGNPADYPPDLYLAAGMLYGGWLPLAAMIGDAEKAVGS